jgi:5,5'-dehydrodivanillate O-demethylase oxygenase subunit
MLTDEENQMITQVGPGTPGGELLRRYWHPVALAEEITDDRPKMRVTILGEELVLYRDASDQFGLLGEHCSHRGTSLYYGFVEGGGLRCPYHGWLYDNEGRCLEQPFEPAQSMMRHTLRHPAYPVQELGGLLFAYLGPPEKQPLLPRWDVVAWADGTRRLARHQMLNCNWVQAEENTADVTHTYFLHGHTMRTKGLPGGEYYYRPIEQFGFQPFEWGLVKSWRYADDGGRFGAERGGGNPLIFPNMLRLTTGPAHSIHWRVPMDDTHTQILTCTFIRSGAEGRWQGGDSAYAAYRDEEGEFPMDTFPSQDAMAWETQGPVFNRSREHLGASDTGIVLFRQLLMDQIARVRRGEDPMALVRDPARNTVIELPGWVLEGTPEVVAKHGGPSARVHSWDNVFGDEHQVYEVPFGTARPRP